VERREDREREGSEGEEAGGTVVSRNRRREEWRERVYGLFGFVAPSRASDAIRVSENRDCLRLRCNPCFGKS
jgi:hypothetical protein